MAELDDWLKDQSAREQRVVRVEDALLADRYGAYFFYRLRFFMVRTGIAAFIHAVRILLLFTAFAIDEFLFLILLAASTALIADTWWGALEVMRSRIRHLQRLGSKFRAPEEIASWLHLSAWLCGAGLVATTGLLAVGLVLDGALSPVLVMAVAILGGASLNIVVRAYHSGAYAVRRVYRPLPSLLATDVLSLVALLALWPMLDIWAFAVAELLAVGSLIAISLWYTTRTYRSLGFPDLLTLLRQRAPLPDRGVLRSALAPAISFGLVGLEALVLVAVLMTADSASTGVLVALLAALSPVIRAGFEWVRLLYFDLARLDVALLAGLRRRFERAATGLSFLIGAITWAIAAIVAVVILGVRDVALITALLPFFTARSVLALAQMRAFTWRAYLRLAATGVATTTGFILALAIFDTATGRILGLTLSMAIAAAALIALPDRRPDADRVAAITDWLASLRTIKTPVRVYRIAFDRRDMARGTDRDERRKAAWRRHRVGRRLARNVARDGGLVTWLGTHELGWYVPSDADDSDPTSWALPRLGGLAISKPMPTSYEDGRAAARTVANEGREGSLALTPERSADAFRQRFPDGIAYDVSLPAPAALAALTSQQRGSVLRDAIAFLRGSKPARSQLPYEISALAGPHGLRLIFLAPRSADRSVRRSWQEAIADLNRVLAAGDSGTEWPGHLSNPATAE